MAPKECGQECGKALRPGGLLRGVCWGGVRGGGGGAEQHQPGTPIPPSPTWTQAWGPAQHFKAASQAAGETEPGHMAVSSGSTVPPLSQTLSMRRMRQRARGPSGLASTSCVAAEGLTVLCLSASPLGEKRSFSPFSQRSMIPVAQCCLTEYQSPTTVKYLLCASYFHKHRSAHCIPTR